ncbi:MAG: alpha-1,2-fucosyltransferase [Deltaproteobacteria bacterium]|nr:alpha-1,2-fucosyltransferase [Deltaproteobacteria bacterium]
MIIVNLMGGLGNQMFQYAAAKQLSINYSTVLKIDATNFQKLTSNKDHNFQLDCFCITASQASKEEVRKYNKTRNRLRALFELVGMILYPQPSDRRNDLLYKEPDGSAFKPAFQELGPNRYLIGYFNSYKYFNEIRDILVNEYTPRYTISPPAQEMIKQIENTNSVSIHIRRGDYVSDPNVQQCVEGIITDNYYYNAFEYIFQRVKKPHFFIFSDAMPWVMSNFKIPSGVTYVNINPPQRGFEDLWIMSKCKHNITAGGSTFSWWASYLNRNADKIVVRTEKISNEVKYNHPDDYFPPDWKIVPS